MDYLRDVGISVRYLHSEIDAIERVEILRALRKGEFNVLVGIEPAARGTRLRRFRWWRSLMRTRKAICD